MPHRLTASALGLAVALTAGLAACSDAETTLATPAPATTPTPARAASTTSATTPATTGSSTATGSATAGTPSRLATPLDAGLGAAPTYLPTADADAAPRGTTAKPALAYPGTAVVAALPSGDVRVDVEGPSYPSSTPIGAQSMPLTFTVTLDRATATVSLAGMRFDVYDHLGAAHPARVTGMPGSLAPGASAHVRVTATVPSGQGLLRLYPGGNVALAGWDYVAETD